MTDQECIEWYQALATLMIERHMKWVVDEVEEEFRIGESFSTEDVDIGGKLTAKSPLSPQLPLFGSVSPFKDEQLDIDRATSPEKLYPPQKRLLLLIDAVEHAVVNLAEIKDHVIGYLGKKANINEIVFMASDSEQKFVLDRQLVRSRLVSARKLKSLLDDLRSRIHRE